MKRAILITGFNNWGKTTHICQLFSGRSRFYQGSVYSIPGVNGKFTVESHSNDDFGADGFVSAVERRIRNAPKGTTDILCAFCPTREPDNDSQSILKNAPFTAFDEIHLLLLKHKWDFHAELRIGEIQNHLSPIKNAQFFIVDADTHRTTDVSRYQARQNQIIDYLKALYP